MKYTLLLLTLTLCWSCNSQRTTQAPAESRLIMLQTFPCRGFCPVYTLTFHQDGRLDYQGERFVQKTGAATVQLTASEIKQLQEEVDKANLLQYPDRIESQVMDAPYATLTVWKAGKAKSVNGSIDRPKPVLELEKLLKNLAEVHGLSVIKGVNPNEPVKPVKD